MSSINYGIHIITGGIYKMTLGERIKFVRKDNNLNQTTFAKKLGISQTHVSKIEKDVEHPSTTLLLFISYMFSVNIEWLTKEKGKPFESSLDSIQRFDLIRHKLELPIKYMGYDCFLEYTDCFSCYQMLTSLPDSLNIDQLKDYYEIIHHLMRNIFLTGVHYKTNKNMSPDEEKRWINLCLTCIQSDITDFINELKKNID